MTNIWPWLAVAGLGAFHGLNPASGWMFAAAWGLGARDGAPVLRALLPLAVGHAAAVGFVAAVVAGGMSIDRSWAQAAAGALLLAAATLRCLRGNTSQARISAPASHTGMALWSFLMATAHGAGLMLVPALVPLCLSDNPAREITASGSLLMALAAIGVHTAAMLAVTGAIAASVCRGFAMHPRLPRGSVPRTAWTALLAVTGVLLITLR